MRPTLLATVVVSVALTSACLAQTRQQIPRAQPAPLPPRPIPNYSTQRMPHIVRVWAANPSTVHRVSLWVWENERLRLVTLTLTPHSHTVIIPTQPSHTPNNNYWRHLYWWHHYWRLLYQLMRDYSIVYITLDIEDECYHRLNCPHVKEDAIPMPRIVAETLEFTPCWVCNP